ncbi:hypothetical protein K523DRAFT_358841 [Schizophyllum commune Tattone D]|nr:hypothetical protein K523DRAFT_358841 [Schizophyllum commune Tattone D]
MAIRRSRLSLSTDFRHGPPLLGRMRAYYEARRSEWTQSVPPPLVWRMTVSHCQTPPVALLRKQEAGGQVSQEARAVYSPPYAHQMLRHGRRNSPLIDERLDRRQNVGPYGPAPPRPDAHLRLAFSLPAAPSHSPASTRPTSRSFRVPLCPLGRFISACRPPVHLALVIYFAQYSWFLLDGIYIRSTPPDPRVRTANGGAQGEVLPSGREEDMTSVLALWPAGRGHLLVRGVQRSEKLKASLRSMAELSTRRRLEGNGGRRHWAKRWQRIPRIRVSRREDDTLSDELGEDGLHAPLRRTDDKT